MNFVQQKTPQLAAILKTSVTCRADHGIIGPRERAKTLSRGSRRARRRRRASTPPPPPIAAATATAAAAGQLRRGRDGHRRRLPDNQARKATLDDEWVPPARRQSVSAVPSSLPR